MSLVESFLAALPAPLRERAQPAPDLEHALAAQLEEARAAWPALAVDDAAFVAFLGTRAPIDATTPVDALTSLRVSDLYLVFGWSRGSQVAFAALDALADAELDRAWQRVRRLPLERDDARQRLREHLFLGDSARLCSFAGTGDLRTWLRVTTRRLLLNIATREGREAPSDDAFFEALTDRAPTADAAYLRDERRALVAPTVSAAVGRLDPRDRLLLRLMYGDRRTVEQIGAIYGVSGATASRWVKRAREALLLALQAELRARIDATTGELNSILRDALGHVDVTLSTLWRASSK